MHITALREDLILALRRTSAAIDPSYSITRASVLIVAKAQGQVDLIRMAATDGKLGVALNLHGTISRAGGGRAMLPHKALLARVTELPEGSSVEISVEDKTFKVAIKSSASKRKFTMSGFDPADYPEVLQHFTDDGNLTCFALEARYLISAAGDVKQSIDPSRIDGALIATDGKAKFRMIACGTSLSIATGELIEAQTLKESAITLPSTLLAAASAFSGGKGDMAIRVQETEAFVRLLGDGCLLYCAKLYASFPEWWRQIMDHLPKVPLFKCSAERLLESVRAVSVAADVEGAAERFVQIDINYVKGECVVSTKKSDKNYGEDELPILEGSPERTAIIHLDGQRLSLALRAAAPGDVEVFYEEINGLETFYLKGEAFMGMFPPVRVVEAPAAQGKK